MNGGLFDEKINETGAIEETSNWRGVKCGVPQGSVLAPIIFVVYINDMTEGINSYMSLLEDDARLLRRVKNEEDCHELKRDLDRMYMWSQTWGMEFSSSKCHVMEIGKSKNRPRKTYKMGREKIKVAHEEKDLGVKMQNTLSPEKHINRLFGEAYKMLQNIKTSFNFIDKKMMRKITIMIRPKLEYASMAWSPHKKKEIRKLKRIQRIAKKLVPKISNMTYDDKLREKELPTLEQRRERGDMVTLYKFVSQIEMIDKDGLLLPARPH